MERSAYFALVNHSKRSAAFDVDAEPGRLAALLEQTDVVIENVGGKRATVTGLAARAVLATNPDAFAIGSSGFGQDGPWSRYRAYAYNLHASCGLGYLTRTQAGEPAEIDLAFADLASAYALATFIAAWAVGPSGNSGVGLDFAMADLISARLNEFVAAATLDPDSDSSVDRANDLAPYSPHGVYPAADGWLAIAVEDDEQHAGLAKILADDRLADPTLATAAARFEQRRSVDALVAEATRSRTAAELAGELRAAGIAAEVVVPVGELPSVAQLAGRGFFTEVEHPVWGRRGLVGIPWRPFGGPPIPLGPPPMLAPPEPHREPQLQG